jgi:hypothetical protein
MPIPDVVPAEMDNDFGAEPNISESSLEPKNRAINSVQQAYAVAETLIYDATRKIRQAAKITKKLNGEPPKSPRELANKGKDWQSNTSTGALSTTCSKIPPRLWMPIQNARYLISSTLPEGTVDGANKTEFYRHTITKAIKSWPKWKFFVQGLTKEVSYFGYGFSGFLDNYEWRPTMFRMDRGFVPAGTEILDDSVPFFAVKYDYLPGDLLQLLKTNQEADRDEWQKENVVNAINDARPPVRSGVMANVRTYEDMIRNGTQWLSFTKGTKVIQTIHLFALEMDGKVSHYVLLADENGGAYSNTEGNAPADKGLLFQQLDQFESMGDVFRSFVFEYGNGTIQGSLGAGQILYDMSVQVELARNDSFDNLKMASRLKIEVPDAKDVNTVKMTVQDDKVILGGAKYQGVNAGLVSNVEAFIALDQQMTRLMDEKVGAFLPPAPVPGTSATATQVNVQVQREDEIRNAILENFLMQFGMLTHSMERRLTDPDSTDKVAKEVMKTLKKKLSTEEIKQLRDSEPTETIIAFTDIVVKQQAAFLQSKTQGPNSQMYDQFQIEQFISQAMVGLDLASVVLPPGEDQNKVIAAARQQLIEGTTLGNGAPVPVLPTDNHWVHMQTLKPAMNGILQQASQDPAKIPISQNILQHYTTHYELGVEAKTIPKDQINPEKRLIAEWEKVIESAQQKAAAEAAMQQLQEAGAAMADGSLPPEELARALPPEQPPPNGPAV